MLRRVIRSLAYGVAAFALLTILCVVLPPHVFPVSWPGGWRNLVFCIGLAIQKAFNWPEPFFCWLFPTPPGDAINFNCTIGVVLTDVLVLWIIFFVAFTVVAHRKAQPASPAKV